MNHGEQIVVYKNVFLRKSLTLFALFCGGIGSGNANKSQQLLETVDFNEVKVLTIKALSSPKKNPSDNIKDLHLNYFLSTLTADLQSTKSPDSLLQDTVNSMIRTTYRDEIQDFVKTLKHLKDEKIPGFTDITDYQARAEEIVRSQHQSEIQKFKTFLSQFIKGRSNHPTDYSTRPLSLPPTKTSSTEPIYAEIDDYSDFSEYDTNSEWSDYSETDDYSTRPLPLTPFWEQLKHKALSHFSSLKGALEEGKNQIKTSPSLQSLSYLKDQTQSFFTKTYQSLQNITRRALFNGSYFLETSYQESKKAIKRSVSLKTPKSLNFLKRSFSSRI